MDMYLETGGLSSPEGASDPTLRTAVAYQNTTSKPDIGSKNNTTVFLI